MNKNEKFFSENPHLVAMLKRCLGPMDEPMQLDGNETLSGVLLTLLWTPQT